MKQSNPFEIVSAHLDKIYREAVKISQMWGTNRINIAVLEEIIRQAKVSEKTGEKEVDSHNKQYNDILDKMVTMLKSEAAMAETKSLKLTRLRMAIKAIKKGYSKGYKESKK